jgi:hypothetical protein
MNIPNANITSMLDNAVNCIITSYKEGPSTLVGFLVLEFIMVISILEKNIGIIGVIHLIL